ncbi:hypothetical protein N7517_011019 [Penicillium concentricum]|uniref:Uncharacterized protein n=1 Tax=Penicillium concentricum TaxID=293559 RepID=A0A9W9UUZ7_9EURO|nr:uncharacterized protein N7517_011019 [Penicillium concentricum]KAJ5356410.1 hypothetical protein N7517_011019 [Penicillium concentricum]
MTLRMRGKCDRLHDPAFDGSMLIISTGFNVFDSNDLPYHSDNIEICCALKGLHLYRRRQQPLDSQGA